MVLEFLKPNQPLRVVLQRVGYTEHPDRRAEEISYIRRAGANFYPRFHLYVDELPDRVRLKLHLDQKQPSYGRYTKHSGEYDSPVVEAEGERIRQLFR